MWIEEKSARVVSVNVGLPRQISVGERVVTTGIFKEPVARQVRVAVRQLNLDDDRQADLQAHGGVAKAVYAYPMEHYAYWQAQYPDLEMPWGMFGENLTLAGLLENDLHIGDCLRVGSAHLQITQPRIPCYKLGIRFGRNDIEKRFLKSGLSGFYLAVVKEGEVGIDDPVTIISRDPHQVNVLEILRLYDRDKQDIEGLKRILAIDALSRNWRDLFSQRLARLVA